MLTQAENEAARRQNEDFTDACADYRALLATHDLPLTVDLTKLTGIYRERLFEQLLTADPGLQARYALARTPEAQRQFRGGTTASVDLCGHELVDELTQAVQGLERAHQALQWPNDVAYLALPQLASGYGLDLGRLLDHYTLSWAGKERARAYFEQVAAMLTAWRDLVQATNGSTRTLADIIEHVTRPFSQQVPDRGPIIVGEKQLYQHLQHNPDLLRVLAAPGPVHPAADAAPQVRAGDSYQELARQFLDDPRLRALLPAA